MKKSRAKFIGNKIQDWNETHDEEFGFNLYHIITFDMEPHIQELSEKGKRENKEKLARASMSLKISIKNLKEWLAIYEKKEGKKAQIRIGRHLRSGRITPKEAKDLIG